MAWILTRLANASRENMVVVASLCTGVASAGVMTPNLWGVHWCKDAVQMYRDGAPEPVDEESKQIAQKILDKVMWDVTSEANVNLFTNYGQNLIHLGSTFSRWAGFVGVPVNFRYRSVSDVEREKITLNNAAIEWDSAAGRQLLDSMVLGERARQFAIARELFYLKSYHAHIDGVMVGFSGFLAYWAGSATSMMYNLKRRLPTGSRMVVYSFFAGIGATLYCLMWDNYSWYRDRKVDRKAAELGGDFAEGGVEFYGKMMQRNIALRALMGPEGGKKYTAFGNDIHLWRSPNMPLSSRRDALSGMAKSLRESSAAGGESSSATA